jgi:hypothetical protein
MKNSEKAETRAEFATLWAEKGRNAFQKLYKTKILMEETDRIMKDEPVAIATVVFIGCAIGEIVITFDMYKEFASKNSPELQNLLALTIGFCIVGVAALASHYLSKKVRESLLFLEEIRLVSNGLKEYEAKEKAVITAQKQFLTGIWIILIVISIAFFLSYYRIFLMKDDTEDVYNWFDIVFPMVLLCGEIFGGMYVSFMFFKLTSYIKCWHYRNQYEQAKKQCIIHTKMTVLFHEEASSENEDFKPSKNVLDCLFRWHNRSIDSDNYLDLIMLKENRIQNHISLEKTFQ